MDNNEHLIDAVRTNDVIKTQYYLEQGADPNYVEDDALYRPIHYAAMYASDRVIGILAVAGADLDAKTGDEEFTALDIAKQHHSQAIINILQDYQSIYACNNPGTTQ